jgi:hypothetical protein
LVATVHLAPQCEPLPIDSCQLIAMRCRAGGILILIKKINWKIGFGPTYAPLKINMLNKFFVGGGLFMLANINPHVSGMVLRY